MRLDWIEDILAVLDTGSMARAAERRLLTQSAFTRRIRTIEDSLGVPLVDRRRKPVVLMPGVMALEPELRDVRARLRGLGNQLRLSATEQEGPLTFVCQHAITAAVFPRIVSELTVLGEASVRVRSGNRDDCLMLLLSGQADFAVMYELPGERATSIPKAFEATTLGMDMLIPICTPSLWARSGEADMPIVSYPPEVFMGKVFQRTIGPRLPDGVTFTSRAETALTLAMLQFALSEIGLAWLPQSLVGGHLAAGQLVRLDDAFPAQALEIKMIRSSEEQSRRGDAVWRHVIDNLRLPEGLQRLPDGPAGLVQPV